MSPAAPRSAPRPALGPLPPAWLLIVRAAVGLRSPFRVEELVVACWKAHPERFGLRGYQYPDANAVTAYLCHARGPVRRGLLKRVRPGWLELTPAGRAAAKGE